MNINEQIKAARGTMGAREFMRLTGINNITRYESGKISPNAKVLQKISDVTGFTFTIKKSEK